MTKPTEKSSSSSRDATSPDASEPELTLGIDGRPWGCRAVLARAASSVAADASSHDAADGVGEIIDIFEVAGEASLWDRVSDVVARVEEAYGRSPMAVRIASLPGRSHTYEAGKLRRHLVEGSTVEVLTVASDFARRPRENDSAAIKLKGDKQSAMLAIGVARLQEPGDTIELGEHQLAGLANMSVGDAPEVSVAQVSVEDVSVDEEFENFDTDIETDVETELDIGIDVADTDLVDDTTWSGSPRLLVAAGAAALILVGAAGVLGFGSTNEPSPEPGIEVEPVSTTVLYTPARPPATTPTTVTPSTTAAPVTAAPTTTTAPSVPANGGAIDLGFLNDADQPPPVEGGPIDLGFLNDDKLGDDEVGDDEQIEEAPPVIGGPIDLGFLDDEPASGSVDLGFLPDAE